MLLISECRLRALCNCTKAAGAAKLTRRLCTKSTGLTGTSKKTTLRLLWLLLAHALKPLAKWLGLSGHTLLWVAKQPTWLLSHLLRLDTDSAEARTRGKGSCSLRCHWLRLAKKSSLSRRLALSAHTAKQPTSRLLGCSTTKQASAGCLRTASSLGWCTKQRLCLVLWLLCLWGMRAEHSGAASTKCLLLRLTK